MFRLVADFGRRQCDGVVLIGSIPANDMCARDLESMGLGFGCISLRVCPLVLSNVKCKL